MQPQAPAPSGGWVSFDDDSGGSGTGGFAAVAAPFQVATSAAPVAATGWAERFGTSGASWAPSSPAQQTVPHRSPPLTTTSAAAAAAPIVNPAPAGGVAAAGAARVAATAVTPPTVPAAPVAPAGSSAIHAGVGLAVPSAMTSPTAALDLDSSRPFPPAASPTGPPVVFPSFATLYGSGASTTAAGTHVTAAPGTSMRAAGQSAPPATIASDSTPAAGAAGAGATAAAGAASSSSVHRLPRPPTSVSRGPPTAPGASNLSGSQAPALPPSVAAGGTPAAISNNPFASSANPTGATAVSRSLDPFADLSVRPALARPPPMAAAKAAVPLSVPTPAAEAGGAPAFGAGSKVVGPLGALAGQGVAAGPGAVTGTRIGLPSTAAAPPIPPPEARPPTGPPGPPAAPSPPASAAASKPVPSATDASVFPSFAALHQQRPPAPPSLQLQRAPAAAMAVPDLLDDGRAPSGAAAAAALVSPTAAKSGFSSPPGGDGTSQPPGATRLELGHLDGFGSTVTVEASSFDSFPSDGKSSSRPSAPQQPQQQQPGAAAKCGPSTPPPPPYLLALDLPSAPAPPVSDSGFTASSANGLPPPPPYSEALGMPDAQGPPVPPPPPYDEALAFPAAGAATGFSSIAAQPLNRAAVTLSQAAASAASAPASGWAVFDEDVFGLQAAAASRAAAAAAAAAASQAQPHASGVSFGYQSAAAKAPIPPPDQICVEVRLPPLKPKEAAWPKRIVAGMGMLFAAPGVEGVAALQWWLQPRAPPHHPGGGEHEAGQGGSQGHWGGGGPRFALPVGAGAGVAAARRSREDADSAPSASVLMLPPVSDVAVACCMLLDDASSSLWTGHKDGRVVCWSAEPGRVASYQHLWRAHLRGKITCMTLTPWGDLWTASSAGTVRAWQYQGGVPGSRPPTKLFECRRCRFADGPSVRSAAPRAHSKARMLCLGPSGRVVWSAGRTGLALWGAYDGMYLGTLSPGWSAEARTGGAAGPGYGAGAATGTCGGDTGAFYRDNGGTGGSQQQQQQMEINPQTGVEASLISRPFSQRLILDPSEEGADAGDPDLVLGAQVIKGLAGAAKLAFRLGKKIRQNFAESSGAGAEVGGGSEVVASSAGSRGKVVALVPGLDQSVYVAYQRGVLEKYTEWGRLLWTRDYGRPVELYSAALVGCLIWLGCGDGFIRTAAAGTGELVQAWKAHHFPVTALAHDTGSTGRGSGLVYSLSEIGSVRGWPAVPPSEPQRLAWRDGLLPSLQPNKLTVLAATWNVNETRPASESLRKWLALAAQADIVSVSLQEVEMGTSSVAYDAAITFLSKGMLERGNQNAQWWATELVNALAQTGGSWVRVALRQMSGLVIVVFVRPELQPYVGEVATANVACGVMGVGGNKGAVAVSMSVYRRRVMFVCSHFAAHQERVEERNENYTKIVRSLHFDNTSKVAQQQQMRQQPPPGDVTADGAAVDSDLDVSVTPAHNVTIALESEDDGHGPGLADAALLVWAGDFNYRINCSFAEVRELACTKAFGRLFQWDQCRAEMDKGNVFRGLREPLPLGHPVFVPTYKFSKGVPHSWIQATDAGGPRLDLPYDVVSQRVPAWTDRVFARGSRPGSVDVAEEEVSVSIAQPDDYNTVLEVTDSDHKPVFALLQVELPGYQQDQKRLHSLASVLAVHQSALSHVGSLDAAQHLPQQPVRASASRLELRPYSTSVLDLINSSSGAFIVDIMAERRGDSVPGGHGLGPLPCWVEVSPTSFSLTPSQSGGGGESPQGQARVLLRALGGDVLRVTETLHLRFVLRPLWGYETMAAMLGPVVTVTVR